MMVHSQLPWFIGGPILGACVVAIRGLLNQRLGITGGFSEVIERVGRRSLVFGWRGWFAIGLVLGGLGFGLAAGGPDFHGYGWMTDTFTGTAQIFIGVLLFAAGVLIAFGAKTAQGCTSGNGLSGSSLASPASFVATAVFFSTAIAVSFLIEALIS
jgi:uncharacterized membrane protein YedE/YeeE